MIALGRVEIAEYNHLDVPLLRDTTTLSIEDSISITKRIKLLNSELSIELVEDYDVVVVWVEACPVVIVGSLVCSTSLHDVSQYS